MRFVYSTKKMDANKIIIITTILNFFVFLIKVTVGIVFSFSTLIADSIQSFIDFLTDIMSLIANKIGKRRANKTYPFGYGQVYYLANLITGFLLFLIGIFIVYQFFFFESDLKPNLVLFILLLIVMTIKLIVVKLLHNYSIKFKSELLIESFKESKMDFISTCIVLMILVLSLFEDFIPLNINVDKIGSLGMAIYVFYTSIKMMISNIRGLLMNDEENNEIKEEIINEINQFKEIDLKKVKVIKMSIYYSVFLQIDFDDNLKIKEYLMIEKELKHHLKSKNKLIRFIDIEPV